MRTALTRGLFAMAVALLASAAVADDMLSGEQIRAALSGNTLTGYKTDLGDIAVYFAPDGTLRDKDGAGSWSIADNNLCIELPDKPQTCWNMGREGDILHWYFDGEVLGEGTVKAGNVNGY